MKVDWLDKLEESLDNETPAVQRGGPREKAARDATRLFFGVYLAYRLEMDVELKMTPWQWELINYEGKKTWSLRNFPFENLGNIELRKDETAPYVEVRFGSGEEPVQLFVNVPEHVSEGRRAYRNCLLFKGEYHETEEGIKDVLPEIMDVWTRSLVMKDDRILADWALDKNLREEMPEIEE